MREIKLLGTYQKPGISRSYQYALFECPVCKSHVERVRKDGFNAKACSHKCSRTGQRRGPYIAKIEISGYLYIYLPEHPDAMKSGYIAEHRLIAEKKIGRKLREDEVVHHINENKHDNRPENLEVLTASEHSRLHAIKRWRDGNGKFTA